MTLVAILTVRKASEEQFRAFERHAAAVMKSHGGQIARTIAVTPDGASDGFKEIHVITFPNMHAFAAYKNDVRLSEMAHLRAESVVNTEVLVGEDGPTYDAS
jgi:uncharacterized protein (DUF1330 family)